MSRLLASQASQKPKIILDDKYMLGDEIGRGAHGIVYKGLNLENGDFVAIKQVSLENVEDEDLKSIMQEIDLLKNLNHKNIVKYLGSSKTKSHLHIILEYVENGSLANIIKPTNFGPFPEPLVAVYIAQVLEGLVYLHDQGVIHRDIKGANILTTKEGLVKLADFGVATKLTETNIDLTSSAGTAYWMAPEVINMSGVCVASDIWSVGCTVIELLTGLPPYYSLQPYSALWNIAQDKQPPIPDSLSPDVMDFVRQCFEKDHRQRLDAKTLLSHPWIQRSKRVIHSSLCHIGTSRNNKEDFPVYAETSNGDDQRSVKNLPAKNTKDSKAELLSVDAANTNKDTERNPLEDIYGDPEKQAVKYSKLVLSLKPDEQEDVIISASQKLADFFHQHPEQKFVFLTQHGFLPLVELLDVPKNRVICSVLQLLNEVIRDNTKIQEDACLVGLIPSIISFAVPDRPYEIRLEAAYFLHQLCYSSSLTLHMFIACRGIPVLVGFLEADYSKHREVVHLAIDGLGQVFKLQRSTPRTDFCHIAAKNGLLLRLINTIYSLNEANRLASLSGGDGLPSDAVVLRQMSGYPNNPDFGPNESNYNVKHRRTENLLPSVTHGSSHASVSNLTDSRNFSLDANGRQPNSPSTSSVEATTSLRLLEIASLGESGALLGSEVLNARLQSPTSSGFTSRMVLPWNADLARESIEIGAGLLLLFSESDTTVKSYMCSQSILSRFFQMFNKIEPAILLKLLKCINHLSTDPYCLENLQRADAIKHLIPNLDLKEDEGPLVSLIHHEVLNALFNLCKMNKRRQEQAAENGIIPHLMHYIMSGSPLKEYAVPLLFDMAHASRTSREQLRAHGGLDVYLTLLEDDIWSVTALDSIAICLAHDNDKKKVEQALLRKDAIQKLVDFFQSCPEQHFLHILEPFLKIITKSSRITNLAVNGLTPLLISRLDHQDAIARLNLLRIIKAVYEHHPCPKQLIVENNLPQKLQNLIEEHHDRQSSGGHVLVKQMATALLKALHINTIL